MATINSVLGPLDTAKLGFTLCHEHVFVGSAGVAQIYPEFIDTKAIVKKGVDDLAAARKEGVDTIVDVSVFDHGRNIPIMEEVSKESGIQIIASTGSWLDTPRVFKVADPDKLADLYVRDIVDGLDGTKVKAGIIKVASSGTTISPEEQISLRAVARTWKRTGLQITTHTGAQQRLGDQQIRIFEEEGVDLSRVYIGHSNNTAALDYLEGMCDKGVYLGLDSYPGRGAGAAPDWQQKTRFVKQMIDDGYGDQLILSHDWVSTLLFASPEMRAQRAKTNPDGFLFITRQVLPFLKQLGVTDKDIKKLVEDNPRRMFEG